MLTLNYQGGHNPGKKRIEDLVEMRSKKVYIFWCENL